MIKQHCLTHWGGSKAYYNEWGVDVRLWRLWLLQVSNFVYMAVECRIIQVIGRRA